MEAEEKALLQASAQQLQALPQAFVRQLQILPQAFARQLQALPLAQEDPRGGAAAQEAAGVQEGPGEQGRAGDLMLEQHPDLGHSVPAQQACSWAMKQRASRQVSCGFPHSGTVTDMRQLRNLWRSGKVRKFGTL